MASNINWWEFIKNDNGAWIRPKDEESVKIKAGNREEDIKNAVSRLEQIKDFSFKISRVKHIVTGEEVIHIVANNKGEYYGYIIVKLSEIDTRVKKLEDYGVVMHQLCWDGFCQTVKANYNQIEVERKEFIDIPIVGKLVDEFAKIYAEYVKDKNIEVSEANEEKFYDIKVDDFKKLYEESSFGYYGMNVWRKALKMEEYTKCNSNRTDFTTKIKGENDKQKVIRFYANKLEKLMED